MSLHLRLLVVILGTSTVALTAHTPCSAGNPAVRRTAIVTAVEKARAAVVNITSERTARAPAGEEPLATTPSQHRANGMGTGIIIDPRGYIVTNQHVVEDVSVIRVRLSDGSSHFARVVGRDRENDLALMKIDANAPLPTVTLGTASDLMVGEPVIAIGNAYGYEHTVSTGIVSALNRDVTLNKEISYKSLIQTDASINPGNSGGPLHNIEGELIGVNVAIRAGAQGIGFAIPVDQMVSNVTDLMAKQRRGGAATGFTCRNRVDARQTPPRYLEIERVDGAAAKAGLRAGDVVVRAGDVAVSSSIDLERALLEARAGDGFVLRVRRGREEHNLEVPLQGIAPAANVADLAWRQLGLRLAVAGSEQVTRTSPTLRGGMMVLEVQPDGPAGRAGFQRGDVLVGLHQWETVNMDNVLYVLNHADLSSFYPLRFYLLRAGQVHRGWLQMPE